MDNTISLVYLYYCLWYTKVIYTDVEVKRLGTGAKRLLPPLYTIMFSLQYRSMPLYFFCLNCFPWYNRAPTILWLWIQLLLLLHLLLSTSNIFISTNTKTNSSLPAAPQCRHPLATSSSTTLVYLSCPAPFHLIPAPQFHSATQPCLPRLAGTYI